VKWKERITRKVLAAERWINSMVQDWSRRVSKKMTHTKK
jgi:hypothetical protein